MATEHDLLRHYITTIDAIHRAGHATEHSYRGALAETRTLMDAIDETIEERGGWPLVESALPLAPQGEGAGG